MMCRRCHRNTRWIGAEPHRKNIKTPKRDDAALIRSRPLCGVYETEQQVASISYVIICIFGPTTRNTRAFSSESLPRTRSGVDTGSREENASKQEIEPPIRSERKRL